MSGQQRSDPLTEEIEVQGSDRSPLPAPERREPIGEPPRKERWRPVHSTIPAGVRKGA